MFDTEHFVVECLLASSESEPIPALKDVVSRAVSKSAALNARFPVPMDPDDDGILHRSAELTVTSAIFPRGFTTGIHNHTMPAVIGLWTGSEDNLFYEQTSQGVLLAGSVRIEYGQVLALTTNAIHDVHVPPSSWSGALHVYLGDLIGVNRSEWSVASMDAVPFDGEKLHKRWLTAARATGMLTEP